jgi:hypothetical protein
MNEYFGNDAADDATSGGPQISCSIAKPSRMNFQGDQPNLRTSDHALRLVNELMLARDYPASAEFEENAADLSVDHARVVEHYGMLVKSRSASKWDG